MAVAEIEAHRVVAYELPAGDRDAGKLALRGAAMRDAEDVAFALGFGAGRGRAQGFARK